MEINGATVKQIIVTDRDGEVLAVITDESIIEKESISVVVDYV